MSARTEEVLDRFFGIAQDATALLEHLHENPDQEYTVTLRGCEIHALMNGVKLATPMLLEEVEMVERGLTHDREGAEAAGVLEQAEEYREQGFSILHSGIDAVIEFIFAQYVNSGETTIPDEVPDWL